MSDKIALITGATSGIGWATAEALAAEGYHLIICGRRAERLEALKTKLEAKVKVHSLCFDVRDRAKTSELIANLPPELQNITALINNAGNAHGLDPIQAGNIDDWDAMMDINVKGLLYVSKAVIPLMIAQKSGTIINIGSIAGKEVYPRGNVYCASKHAVDALSKGMRLDLHAEGIRVASVNPGLVETEFSEVRFKGDKSRAKQVYEGYTPLYAQDIAEVIVFMLSRPAHVNLADVTILASDQANSYVVNRQNT